MVYVFNFQSQGWFNYSFNSTKEFRNLNSFQLAIKIGEQKVNLNRSFKRKKFK